MAMEMAVRTNREWTRRGAWAPVTTLLGTTLAATCCVVSFADVISKTRSQWRGHPERAQETTR